MRNASSNAYFERGSASIDPYELLPQDTAENVLLSQWIIHVEKELVEHRSPFVAASIIFKQMHEKAVGLRHPDKFLLETSLRVLERCANHLASPFKEIFLSALHELLPALILTRATHSPEKGEETFSKHTYAECFLSIYKIFLHHRRTIEVHERRVEVEYNVMDRLIAKLEGLWVKFCFTAWRTHTKRIREKKKNFSRIARVHFMCQVTSTMIGRWRHMAHTTMIGEKNERKNQLTREFEALKIKVANRQKEAAKRREEVKSSAITLQNETSKLEASRRKRSDMQELLDATKKSAKEHWREWQRCMVLLFQDAYLPGDFYLEVGRREKGDVHFVSNITDSSILYYNRARDLASKVDIQYIHRLLGAYGLYSPSEMLVDQELLLSSNPLVSMKTGNDAKGTPSYFLSNQSGKENFLSSIPNPPGTPVNSICPSPVTAAKRGWLSSSALPTPSIETVNALVSLACGPVVSPFSMQDGAHFHRDKINFVATFLNYLYAGGHCSLFVPPPTMLTSSEKEESRINPESKQQHAQLETSSAQPTTTAIVSTARKESEGTGTTLGLLNFSIDNRDSTAKIKKQENPPFSGDGSGVEELSSELLKEDETILAAKEGVEEEEFPIPEEGIGEVMLSNITEGLEQLQSTCAGRDELFSSVRRCMVHTDVDKVRNYLEGLYEHLSIMEVPLNRYKIEEVTRRTVSSRSDYRVLKALYPSDGIVSFDSLVNYLTSVAEFTSWSLWSVAEMLETLYEMDWRDEMKLILHSPDVRHFFTANQRLIRTLQRDLVNPEIKDQLNFEKVQQLLALKFDIPDSELIQIWQNAGQKVDVVLSSELNQVLYLVGNWNDPSPFNHPLQKIISVLESLCISTKAKGDRSLQ